MLVQALLQKRKQQQQTFKGKRLVERQRMTGVLLP